MTPPAGGRKSSPRIEVVIASPLWKKKPRSAALVRKAIVAAASLDTGAKSVRKPGSTSRTALAILLTNDSAIRALNRNWRKLDAPTNVLSFPAPPLAVGGPRPAVHHLGDIAIAYETAAREATAERKSFDHHLVHLAVHGYLHLLGYDHAADRDAEKMERLETRILARLSVPDPYADRTV